MLFSLKRMNILIIGGSRFVGPLLIKKLQEKRHAVTVFNRGILQSTYSNLRFIQGDRNNGFFIPQHFDVVIDMCAYTGEQTTQALKDLHFDFFVHFSTVAVYKKTTHFPLTEQSEIGSWPLWGSYNKGKVACEKVLQKSGITHATLRPVYILGGNNYLDRERFMYAHIKNKKPLLLPGDGSAQVQFVFVEDVAASLALLAEKKVAGIFNCAEDEVVSLQELVTMMGKIVGVKPVLHYNKETDGALHNEQEFPFANETFYCENEKLKKLGLSFTPLLYGLERDYQQYYKKII